MPMVGVCEGGSEARLGCCVVKGSDGTRDGLWVGSIVMPMVGVCEGLSEARVAYCVGTSVAPSGDTLGRDDG